MKASELRIGNWVHQGDNFAMNVVGIFDDEVYLDFPNNEGGMWRCKIEDVYPVELNQDWLKEFGFLYWDNGWWSKSAMKYYADISSFYWQEKAIFFGDVKYVHEFQNIVYFFTKEEL